jgi:hypothetical protein
VSASHAGRGREWQDLLEALHTTYNRSGRAHVWTNPPPVKMLGQAQVLSYQATRGGRLVTVTGRAFPAVFDDDGPPDFLVLAGGVSMLLDAKQCAADRWPLDKLEIHQAEAFDRHVRAGGWAAVLLRLEHRPYLLPWLRREEEDDLRARWWAHHKGKAERGWAALGHEQCRVIGVALRSVDWLGEAVAAVRALK